MSVGIHNIRSKGSYTNELEFEWDTKIEAQVYIKVSERVCVFQWRIACRESGESKYVLAFSTLNSSEYLTSKTPIYWVLENILLVLSL